MKVSIKIICIFAMGLLTVSCHHDKKATVAPAARVKVVVVTQSPLDVGRSYSGTIEESSGTALSFAAPGTIQSFKVNVGDRVAKGQLIGTLDATSLKNAYDISLATLNQAQDAYDRMKVLHDDNSLPDMQWVEVQNTLSQAKSAAAIARKALDDANLYASQSGYVSEKTGSVGLNAVPGIPVVKIVTIDPVKVSISVPENAIAALPQNAHARISVGALGGKTYQGVLVERGVAAQMLSRAYDVKFRVDNPSMELLPGMICDVTIESDSVENVIMVPIDAVLLDADNHNFVWLSHDGKAKKQLVEVKGLWSGNNLIISDGLQIGDSLIVTGQQKVSNGTPVIDISK